jgi:hypothetical protein
VPDGGRVACLVVVNAGRAELEAIYD